MSFARAASRSALFSLVAWVSIAWRSASSLISLALPNSTGSRATPIAASAIGSLDVAVLLDGSGGSFSGLSSSVAGETWGLANVGDLGIAWTRFRCDSSRANRVAKKAGICETTIMHSGTAIMTNWRLRGLDMIAASQPCS